MLKVGLTGNYFTGLDDVTSKFKEDKIPVFEVDLIIKFLFYNNSQTIKKIQKQFGKNVFTDNVLDLSKFDESTLFRQLIKTIEIDIIFAFEKWKLKQKSKYVIFKSQILFEMNWQYLMNFNITVFKPIGFRINEIQLKNNINAVQAYDLINNEMDQFQKNNLSDFVIHNYNSYDVSVESQITNINKFLYTKSYA